MTRMTSLRTSAGALALIAAAAMATAACGRDGGLERPGPMFGLARADDRPQDRSPDQGADRSGTAARPRAATPNTPSDPASKPAASHNTTADEGDNTPATARDLRDPAQRLTPLSASPIQGLSDPLGPPVSTQPPG